MTLSLIVRSFNAPREAPRTSIRADVVEGLRYVLRHPLLRNISAMMALINFVSVTVFAQLVLFAKERFAVSDGELGLLFAATAPASSRSRSSPDRCAAASRSATSRWAR